MSQQTTPPENVVIGAPGKSVNPKLQCPHCHKGADGHICAEFNGDPANAGTVISPEDGSMNVCGYCAEVSVYQYSGLSLRFLNAEELADKDLMDQLNKVQSSLRKFNALRKD